MFGTSTPKTSVCAHLVKLYKHLLRLALEVSEIMKNKLFSPSFWTNQNLKNICLSGYTFSHILDQHVHTVETKNNDTRVLQRLDSSHGKCSYPGPEECFYRQCCYLSASMWLFLPTLDRACSVVRKNCHTLWTKNAILGFFRIYNVLKLCSFGYCVISYRLCLEWFILSYTCFIPINADMQLQKKVFF